jgi:hypothetical protein
VEGQFSTPEQVSEAFWWRLGSFGGLSAFSVFGDILDANAKKL